MPLDVFISLLVIAASAAFTPGPNNAAAASFAANHGVRAVLPHVFGVGVGFPVMIFTVGMFLGEIFQQSEALRTTLRIVGAGVLLWMAWRTATAGKAGEADARKPFTFWQSAGFQWVNPKGWTFAIAITAQFVNPENPVQTALICGLVFGFAGFSSITVWSMAGHSLMRFLNNDFRRTTFNWSMGALIALSVLLLFIE